MLLCKQNSTKMRGWQKSGDIFFFGNKAKIKQKKKKERGKTKTEA